MHPIISEKNDFQGFSFFSKYLQFYVAFGNAEKSWEDILWFWDNSIWIGCVKHSFWLRKNTCYRMSICGKTVPRFQILLKQSSLSWFSFKVIKKYEKITAVRIPAVFCFGHFNMFTDQKCFDTGLFGDLSNPTFCSL